MTAVRDFQRILHRHRRQPRTHVREAQPAFLIVGDPIHKAKRVKRCVDSLNFKLKQFYLLPYSPQSDPGESVWAHVERKVVRQWVESAEDIKRLAFGALRSI